MAFIAKNPLNMPEVRIIHEAPTTGTRALYASANGWYDFDSNAVLKKIATEDDIAEIKEMVDALIAKPPIKTRAISL